MLINHQTPYLIEIENSSGTQLLANIVNHEILGLKIGANTIVPWLIKNTITDILEKDDNYLAKNITQKYEYKKDLQSQLQAKFEANGKKTLHLKFETVKDNILSKTIIKVTALETIKS